VSSIPEGFVDEKSKECEEALSANKGLLEGLRILDLSTYVAGPSGMMGLAQMGAEVIRIDPLGGATDVRRLPVDANGHSLYWAGLNKGKRSIEIDIRSDEGRKIVEDLLANSGPEGGIVLTNAVGNAWLSYEHLVGVRPDLIFVHITGREDGKPAVDYTVNCEVGLPYVTGPADFERPVNHVLPAWDLVTGAHAATAILAAQLHRLKTGEGRHITIALADVAIATMANLGFVADVVVNDTARLRDGNYLFGSFGCDFRTKDGDRVMVVALTDRHWRNLIAMTDTADAISALERSLDVKLSEESARYQYRELLAALFAPWFESHNTQAVHEGLEKSQVLWGPYRTIEEMVRDKESLYSKSTLFENVNYRGIGVLPTPKAVARGTGSDGPPAPASLLGEDTDKVLHEILGLDQQAIDALRRSGVIGGA
jgi:2-methylfumaryl-CoA isomerase